MIFSDTPLSERIIISFFGLRNSGKSSLLNLITNQDISVVSPVKGTTTDPVRKAMEILPLGPVCLVDTPGLDDEGELGKKRIKKALKIIDETDIAVIVTDVTKSFSELEKSLKKELEKRNIKYIIALNKCDLEHNERNDGICVSALTGGGKEALLSEIAKFAKKKEKHIINMPLNENDTVILVIPIDDSAPKGRLILPQQQVLRELLEKNCSVVCCREYNLLQTVSKLKVKPRLVITDSKVFKYVSEILPKDILLTSFSILFADYKGILQELLNGAEKLDNLNDNDFVLICEGCTHHRQCNDIGTVLLPNLIKKYTGKNLRFAFMSGKDFPEKFNEYSLIIHCGGCMLTETEVKNRIRKAIENKIPIVNYGIAIAKINGILKRCTEIF